MSEVKAVRLHFDILPFPLALQAVLFCDAKTAETDGIFVCAYVYAEKRQNYVQSDRKEFLSLILWGPAQ